MGQKDKLIAKLCSNPKNFTFEEADSLLSHFGYHSVNKGKTSGSRIMFIKNDHNDKILLHKPHPRKELPDYQIKQLIEHLKQEGLI